MSESSHPNDEYNWAKLVPELTVMDFECSLKFYSEILGFKIMNQRTNPNFAYLDKEGIQFMIEEFHEDGWNVGNLEKPLGRGINFQIELKCINELFKNIKKHNVDLYRPVKETWYEVSGRKEGQREFLVQDPDGYLLRFSQYLGVKD